MSHALHQFGYNIECATASKPETDKIHGITGNDFIERLYLESFQSISGSI